MKILNKKFANSVKKIQNSKFFTKALVNIIIIYGTTIIKYLYLIILCPKFILQVMKLRDFITMAQISSTLLLGFKKLDFFDNDTIELISKNPNNIITAVFF